MRQVLTLSKFAEAVGFPRGKRKGFQEHLKRLLEIRAVEVQQGGFLGDSMHHPKIVVIRDIKSLKQHFSKRLPLIGDEIHTERQPRKEVSREKWVESGQPNTVQLYYLKHTGHEYYITLDPSTVAALDCSPGDLLKIKLIEAHKHRELLEPT
jgi:hypothetical protein